VASTSGKLKDEFTDVIELRIRPKEWAEDAPLQARR
jgi:hypothetical protein